MADEQTQQTAPPDIDTAITSFDTAFTAYQQAPDQEELKNAAVTSYTKTKETLAAWKADIAKQLEKPKAPDKYELKLPDGSYLDPSTPERISAYAKEKGLSQEAAQEVLNREHEAVTNYHQTLQKQVDEAQAAWVKQATEDKEIGPELKKNVELGKRVLDKFGSQELKDALNKSGFGDHPEVIRFFTRIGKLMADDKLVHSGTQSQPAQKTAAEVLFPTMAQNTQ